MKTKPDTSNFICLKCGACCRWQGHVLLTRQDIAAIAAELEISQDNFIQNHTVIATNRAQLSLSEKQDGACCFLSFDNRCRIYNSRPQQCRDFPKGWAVDGCPALNLQPSALIPALVPRCFQWN